MNTLRASVLVAFAAISLISCSSALRVKPRPECTLPDRPDQAGLTLGKVLKQMQPVPPPGREASGFACAAVTIDVEGRPTDLVILATDNPQFANSFINVLARWRFEPTLRDGTPVPFRTVLTTNFTRY
jgi:Gram-negative bacterial TonB protein C-terminal